MVLTRPPGLSIYRVQGSGTRVQEREEIIIPLLLQGDIEEVSFFPVPFTLYPDPFPRRTP
jgi:hypothetical protein